MTTNYSSLVGNSFSSNQEAFLEYILQKDTIILSESWEEWLICSDWVAQKLHNDMERLEKVKDSLFYRDGDTIYFIFSRYYSGVGEVKIFFDTTEYINSQIIIIKVSAALILLWLFIYILAGKLISKYTLRNLKYIAGKAKNIDVAKKYSPMKIDWHEEDEIQILAQALNGAFCKIEKQTHSLKQFITDVSHEFKTPLMVINSDIDLYEKKKEKWLLKKDEDTLMLQNMKQKTAKLNQLIETLFLLTRMEENISKIQFRKRDLGRLLNQLSQEQLKNYPQKDIQLKTDFETWVMQRIEESTFNIIVENLISNAIKFSPEPITLSIWVKSDHFYIKDNGVWMTTQEQKKIWEKFYRKDTKIEWFGVWLYLVKRIVELYWWKIDIESKKGQWTQFNIFFKS